jgi:hypothetical protein
MRVKAFGKSYRLETDKNYKPIIIEDENTGMTYEIRVRQGDVEINLLTRRLFEGSALPPGRPCPACHGSGRV